MTGTIDNLARIVEHGAKRGEVMVADVVPHFCNDTGVARIRIGVSEFKCMGASPPHDHPHVFLDMGSDKEIICPYCSTVYVRDGALSPRESDPPGCRAGPQH